MWFFSLRSTVLQNLVLNFFLLGIYVVVGSKKIIVLCFNETRTHTWKRDACEKLAVEKRNISQNFIISFSQGIFNM